jgi:hypothetical protein
MKDAAYARTRAHDGVTLNYRTLEMLTAAERRLGFTTVLTQGSYTAANPESGSTHAGGGALDVRATGLSSATRGPDRLPVAEDRLRGPGCEPRPRATGRITFMRSPSATGRCRPRLDSR